MSSFELRKQPRGIIFRNFVIFAIYLLLLYFYKDPRLALIPILGVVAFQFIASFITKKASVRVEEDSVKFIKSNGEELIVPKGNLNLKKLNIKVFTFAGYKNAGPAIAFDNPQIDKYVIGAKKDFAKWEMPKYAIKKPRYSMPYPIFLEFINELGFDEELHQESDIVQILRFEVLPVIIFIGIFMLLSFGALLLFAYLIQEGILIWPY